MSNLDLSGLLLSLLCLATFRRSFFERNQYRLEALLSGAILVYLVILTWLQFRLWSGNDLAVYFLPPHSDWSYFAYFSLLRYWSAYLISFVLAGLFYFLLPLLNHRFADRFFYNSEYVLAPLSLALVGYPALVFYLPLVIGLGVVLSFFRSRVSFFYLWAPTALFVIIISKYWLLTSVLWRSLKIF